MLLVSIQDGAAGVRRARWVRPPDRVAVETANSRRRSAQQSRETQRVKACGFNRATLKVRRVSGIRRAVRAVSSGLA